MCAGGLDFKANLGTGRYGVPKRSYTFSQAFLNSPDGTFSVRMRQSCSALGMKPVCDHPSYCRNDAKSVYLGQYSHIAYRPYRNINGWFPSGWSKIKTNWDGLCSYTNNANGNYALCNIPINTHAWRRPSQYNPGFMCAKSDNSFSARLGSKNGVRTNGYNFQRTALSAR